MKILIVGDYCPRYRTIAIVERGNYASLFPKWESIMQCVDYSIVNLECPVVANEVKPILKCGPNLKTTRKGVEVLKLAGFNCCTLANNHILDYGADGLKNTIQVCQELGLDYVGAGNNLHEAKRILYKKIAGETLAIVNCCEHEFSIATEKEAGSNPLNPLQQYYDIHEAKENADHVLVIVHGGHEHFQLPSPRMVETYRFFIDAGADAVINHHQHCYSGFEYYKDKPIFYGLGNFCFDNDRYHSGSWTEGYAVMLTLSSGCPSFVIYPYLQCAKTPKVELLPNDAFNPFIDRINSIIASEDQLNKETKEYFEKSQTEIAQAFSPIGNRFFRAAVSRGWIPSLVSRKRKIRIENKICCEAHRDKLQYYLNKRLK